IGTPCGSPDPIGAVSTIAMPIADYWLYQHLAQKDPDSAPRRSMLSAVHWMESLSFEITQEHGATSSGQLASCRAHFLAALKERPGSPPCAEVFETLFHSLTFSLAVTSLAEHNACAPWVIPTAIIAWYYSGYNACRSCMAAYNCLPADKHSAAS